MDMMAIIIISSSMTASQTQYNSAYLYVITSGYITRVNLHILVSYCVVEEAKMAYLAAAIFYIEPVYPLFVDLFGMLSPINYTLKKQD